MYKVVVAPRINQKGLDLLATRKDIAVEVVDDTSLPSLGRALIDADAAIVRAIPVPRSVLEPAKKLKVIARHGVGYDNIDIACVTERRIPVALTINANAISVAEQTLFFMLALAKNGARYDRAARTGDFKYRESLECMDISGKQLLVVGFGRIGRAVAERARAFGMEVVIHDPLVPAEVIRATGYAAAPALAEVLPTCDVLTVHIPLGPATKGFIGAPEMARMKPSAFIINTARGGIVDEAALVAALKEKRIRGAGLDVFETEPPAADNPLLALDNVILSPHSAGLTRECSERMAVESAENVFAGLAGKLNPAAVVNREVLSALPGKM
jgi:D-3-phosphoglycerate dehydrogenase